ncbi:hypothetical protein [Streptomyces sp. NPDC088847]|uniref:hypothetical protein n=1 Tax=Streptomyces sp. NPDC088847 TaxID=3365909 RepID=UPI0037F93ACC
MTAQIMTRPRPTTAGPDDDASQRLGAHILDVVHRQDAPIPAERRALHTAPEMRARLAEVRGEQSCDACGGNGGHTETISDNGVTRQNWVRCGSCNGSGTV